MITFFEKNKIISRILFLLILIEIFYFSSLSSIPNTPKSLFIPIIYHFVVFFLFSFLLIVSITGTKRISIKHILIILIISIGYALLDEFHQSFIPGRDAGLQDIITDVTGIVVGIFFYLITKLKRN